MSYDSTLGFMAGGVSKVLPLLPANATREEQMAAINEIISALNNFNREIVGQDEITVTLTGAAIETTTVPHRLGYKPRIFAYLDSRSLQLDLSGGLASSANLPLPTGLSYTIGGGQVTVLSMIEAFTDAQNVYFRCLNGNATTGSLPIKYFLTRDPAN